MADAGYNSISDKKLLSFIERYERLDSEKKAIAEDQKELMKEAVGEGYDAKAMRAVLKRRAADAAKLAEHEAIVETYLAALGEYADSPLGQAALKAAQ